MSTITNSTSQSATIVWDQEQVKSVIKESADAFIDAVQPQVATLLKSSSVALVPTMATAGGAAMKAGVASTCPIVSPSADLVIDTSSEPLVASIIESASPLVDSCVAKTGNMVKQVVPNLVDSGVDLSSRSFSIFNSN